MLCFNRIFIVMVASVMLASITAAESLKLQIIRPNQTLEKKFLVEDRAACNEIGTDPRTPYTRIADGEKMYYIYKFSPGKGNMAFLLLNVSSQFLISASDDNGKSYKVVSAMKECEQVGTRIFIDLTPLAKKTGDVLLKFEDKHKEDGWGALTSEIRYYQGGKATDARFVLDKWTANSSGYNSGKSISADRTVSFNTEFNAPSGWKNHDLAIYIANVMGDIKSVSLNDKPVKFGRTWDQGYWADVSSAVKSGGKYKLTVYVDPVDGKAGLWTPVRVGLRYPACAVPSEKTIDSDEWKPNRNFEPYRPDEMNFLAGNFMQTLYDDRYDLLAFAPSERMTVHYLHDTFRSLAALADEERYTPAARVELIRKLYNGCKGGLLPGGEYLYSFKHDQRPIDIRPYPDSTDLVAVQKMDNWTYLCPIGVTIKESNNKSDKFIKDSKLSSKDDKFSFTRRWVSDEREVIGKASYRLGDTGIPPSIEFSLDGDGPVNIDFKEISESGKWFVPGSWGAEAIMLPDGKELWAHKDDISFDKPDFKYILIRGGNGIGDNKSLDYSYCKALMIMWDNAPDRIISSTKDGGRNGKQINTISFEYKNEVPSKVKITLMPFSGYPEALKAPRAIAENILNTGKTGMGIYDAVTAVNSNGIGMDGLAAAAYILKKYNSPEAEEAEQIAVNAMRSFIELDKSGTRTNELYYVISGCQYLKLLGYDEFDEWARIWADRILYTQKPDGSWEWLNFQLRCMEGLIRAYELLGDQKYIDAVKRGLETIEYKDNNMYWKGNVDYYDDFGGATTYAMFGYFGNRDMAQKALDARQRYIDDRGFVACSDLNPYMLGLSAAGFGFAKEPKQTLSLTQSLIYNDEGVELLDLPTSYIVNMHHPLSKSIDFIVEE